jgi:hypothetical protein
MAVQPCLLATFAVPRLIREDDRAVYGDKGYASNARKRAAEKAGVKWAVQAARQRARKAVAW